jgi:hypothetical protein
LHFIAFVAASTNPLFAAVCVLRSFAVVEEEEEEEEKKKKRNGQVM